MHSGNRVRAPIQLGISRCYLHRLLNQFNLAAEEMAQEEFEDDEPMIRDFEVPHAGSKRPMARVV